MATARTYDEANQLLRIVETENGSTTKDWAFTFDGRGNRTQQYDSINQVTKNYGYNQANELTSLGTWSYGYNGDGLRMSKSGSLSSEQFTWDVASGLPLLLQDGQASFIYGPGGMLLAEVKTADSATYYYHQDRLGSVRALTTSTGSVTKRYEYDAYGKQTLPSFSLAYNPFGYTGEYTDAESGLIYLRARYYDPSTQQFLTVDPLFARTEQAYAYAAGSPLNLIDPTGHCPWCLLAVGGAIIGGVVGAVSYTAVSVATGQEVTVAGVAGAAAAGAIAGGVGVIAAPIAAMAGLGTGLGGVVAVNAAAGIGGYAVESLIDPNTRFTAGGMMLAGGFGALGGVASAFFPTRGMSNFRQVGFPRTIPGLIPPFLGGRAGPNAMNALWKAVPVSTLIGTVGPVAGSGILPTLGNAIAANGADAGYGRGFSPMGGGYPFCP